MRFQMILWQFLKQLLNIDSGKIAVDESTGYITLPIDFCTTIDSQNVLIEYINPYIHIQYTNNEWLVERVILATKMLDVSN
jgi:hypothetical protein